LIGGRDFHLGDPEEYQNHYITFTKAFGKWTQFSDSDVESANESGALEDRFREKDDSTQTANILLSAAEN
jgi:hypothetical protein